MTKHKKMAYTETVIDKQGIKRVYGYTSDGLKYFLNLYSVARIYKMMGIKGFEEVI